MIEEVRRGCMRSLDAQKRRLNQLLRTATEPKDIEALKKLLEIKEEELAHFRALPKANPLRRNRKTAARA